MESPITRTKVQVRGLVFKSVTSRQLLFFYDCFSRNPSIQDFPQGDVTFKKAGRYQTERTFIGWIRNLFCTNQDFFYWNWFFFYTKRDLFYRSHIMETNPKLRPDFLRALLVRSYDSYNRQVEVVSSWPCATFVICCWHLFFMSNFPLFVCYF